VRERSVETNLTEFTYYLAEILDKNPRTQVDSVYTDFMKLSDKVDHQILLRVLSEVGLSDALCDLFENYLLQSRQYVVYKGARSHTYNSTSGVSQEGIFFASCICK